MCSILEIRRDRERDQGTGGATAVQETRWSIQSRHYYSRPQPFARHQSLKPVFFRVHLFQLQPSHHKDQPLLLVIRTTTTRITCLKSLPLYLQTMKKPCLPMEAIGPMLLLSFFLISSALASAEPNQQCKAFWEM